jgi:hypothetical protein
MTMALARDMAKVLKALARALARALGSALTKVLARALAALAKALQCSGAPQASEPPLSCGAVPDLASCHDVC